MEMRAELVLVRDLLQHLKTRTQVSILRSLRAQGHTWLLINYEKHLTRNVLTYWDPAPDWCEINLELPPFSLVPSKVYESDGSDKHYGLFRISQMQI